MKIELLKHEDAKPWLLKKHYARRIPPISYCFGLIIDEKIEGICSFGIPASRFKFSHQPYELNRLVVNEGLQRNTLSQFVSLCLKSFPKSCIVVSYADINKHHCGYIYQATNWIYTGISSEEKNMFIDDKIIHRKSLYNLYGTSSILKLKKMGLNIRYEMQKGKHRYFQFIGSKKEKKAFRKEVLEKYKEQSYPKGDNIRYECSYDPNQKRDLYKLFF